MRKINTILEKFDFAKVHKVMEVLDWKYFEYGKGLIMPDENHLKKTAKQVLEYVLNMSTKKKKDCFTLCGGFKASAYYYKDRVKELKLEFIIESI